jgi:hypothetical protein
MSQWNPNQLPHVYLIDEDGTMEALWWPELDLGELDLSLLGASPTVERASSVEPNPVTGRWDVTLADGTFLGSFESRMEAVWYEVQILNERLSRGESIARPSSRDRLKKNENCAESREGVPKTYAESAGRSGRIE